MWIVAVTATVSVLSCERYNSQRYRGQGTIAKDVAGAWVIDTPVAETAVREYKMTGLPSGSAAFSIVLSTPTPTTGSPYLVVEACNDTTEEITRVGGDLASEWNITQDGGRSILKPKRPLSLRVRESDQVFFQCIFHEMSVGTQPLTVRMTIQP